MTTNIILISRKGWWAYAPIYELRAYWLRVEAPYCRLRGA